MGVSYEEFVFDLVDEMCISHQYLFKIWNFVSKGYKWNGHDAYLNISLSTINIHEYQNNGLI